MRLAGKVTAAACVAVALMFGVADDAAAAKKFKVAVGDAGGSAQHALGVKFVELLEAKTNGEYTAELFLNGQLGSEQDTVNEASIGTLDFSILAINNVTPFSPTVGVFTMPYVILSLEDAEKLTQGDVGQELIDNTIRDAGVRIIGWTYTGFRVLTNSKKPVKTLEDLAGLKVRVPKNEIMIDSYKAWGIDPIPMAWSETLTALTTKTVDGQDNPYLTIHSMKFYESQSFVTEIRYIFSIEPLIVSEAVFQDQSPEVQAAILEAGKEATLHSAQHLRDSEAAIKEDLVAKGMQIDQPADGEKAWIEAATTNVWPNYYDSIGGIEKLNNVLVILGRPEVE